MNVVQALVWNVGTCRLDVIALGRSSAYLSGCKSPSGKG